MPESAQVGPLLRFLARLDERLFERLQARRVFAGPPVPSSLRSAAQRLCESACRESVRFSARRLGGVGARLRGGLRRQQQQYWIDVVCLQREVAPVLRTAKGDLYELPPPMSAAELPPRPHSPPSFSSSGDDDVTWSDG